MPLTYFRPRGDIKSNWELANPILKLREMGLEWETTVGVGKTKIKFGDGVTAWNNLNYAVDVASSIQLDTKSNWTSKNPVLGKGEMGLEWETTVGVGEINIKVGDGTTAWNDLSYGFVSDITNKEIKIITEYSGEEDNPALEDGDTLSEAAGKLNKQQDFLKTTLGYERLATMAETLGGLSNEDFMGVMEKLNSIKFDKTSVYNGTDSTSTSLAASANALKTVKDLTDTNTTAISQLNSDIKNSLYATITDNADLIELRDGVYYYNGWANMTGTKPFANAYGVWIKRTPYNNTTQNGRIDCVININTGAVYVREGGESGSWVTPNADLDGHLFMNTSHTGIDAGTGTTRYRLQINPDGEIALYKSTDSGASWPGKKTIANFE